MHGTGAAPLHFLGDAAQYSFERSTTEDSLAPVRLCRPMDTHVTR
jgi:hypothetical protein